jgi:ATP-dependent Clp protease ATP-binding subunit ClpA
VSEVDMLGVPLSRFDPELLRATRNFATAVDAAAQACADLVEPVHLLVAFGRMPGGLTAELFARHHLPVEALSDALRPQDPREPISDGAALTPRTASAATRTVFAALVNGTVESAIGERQLLAATLRNLDGDVTRLLRDYARIDIKEWIAAADAAPVRPWATFDGSDRLITGTFSPGAQVVLRTMVSEASALNRTRLGTVLLLHAMAAVPGGIIEQACHFLQHDVRSVRVQLFALTGGRVGSAIAKVNLCAETIEAPLRLVLDKAATIAAARHSKQTCERDLLVALLDIPGGLAASFFEDIGVNVARLRHYAVEYGQESANSATSLDDRALPVERGLALLREEVVGQQAVVEALLPHVELIKRALRRGYRTDDRPRGTFLFCGPSGTGKTMTARVLAKVIYGSEDDLVMFEMGQFNGWESINNFIGAPPAYVGFGQGKLTNALRDNPRRVLLFDEVEKADKRVFDALLRLLDEGRISDPAGPVRDARDAVIVLTSNLAMGTDAAGLTSTGDAVAGLISTGDAVAGLISNLTKGGAAAKPTMDNAGLRRRLEGHFRPEFLNRIDGVVQFTPFGQAELEAIASLGLRKQAARAADELGVDLTWAPQVPEHIARTAATLRRAEAARGVNRCVGDLVVPLLRLLDEAEEAGRTVGQVHVTVVAGRLTIQERLDA